jgi:hypothetical protein
VRRRCSARTSSSGAPWAASLVLLWALGDPRPALAQTGAQTPAQLAAASLIDLEMGGEIVSRRFDYQNGIQPVGSRSTLPPAPGASVRAQVFPLARASAAWEDLGFVGEYRRIFSDMNDSGSAAADAFPSSWSAGLRARIHPGSEPHLILGVSVEYTFASRRAVGQPPFELPDVTYRSVRPAIDTRVYLGRFSILEELAFRAVVDRDAISTRFYSPQGYGLDAEFGAALMVARGIEVRLAADYELYTFVFNAPVGAAFAAGSARDEIYGARLALAFVL